MNKKQIPSLFTIFLLLVLVAAGGTQAINDLDTHGFASYTVTSNVSVFGEVGSVLLLVWVLVIATEDFIAQYRIQKTLNAVNINKKLNGGKEIE